MRRIRFRLVSLFLAFVLANTVAIEAQAQNVKRFVVGGPAGHSLDRIARALAAEADLKSAWDAKTILIDNQAGRNRITGRLTSEEYIRTLPADGSASLMIMFPEGHVQGQVDLAPAIAGLADLVQIAYLGSATGPNGKFWYGVFGAPGMSRESARRLEAVIQQAMRSTDLTAVFANTLNYQQDRPVSAAALAQALRASTLAAAAAGATAGAGAAQQQSNPTAATDDPKVIGGVFRP